MTVGARLHRLETSVGAALVILLLLLAGGERGLQAGGTVVSDEDLGGQVTVPPVHLLEIHTVSREASTRPEDGLQE